MTCEEAERFICAHCQHGYTADERALELGPAAGLCKRCKAALALLDEELRRRRFDILRGNYRSYQG